MNRILFIGGPLDGQILYVEFKPDFILDSQYHYHLLPFDYAFEKNNIEFERKNVPIYVLCGINYQKRSIARQIITTLELDLSETPLN